MTGSASINFGKKSIQACFRLKEDGVNYIITPFSNDRKMFVSEFLPLLRNYDFSNKLCETFLRIPHKAINFTTNEMKYSEKEMPVEIIVSPAPELKGTWPNSSVFEYWTNNWAGSGYAYSFNHPNNKEVIVFPTPTERDFSHFMTFLKNSDADEKAALWDLISKEFNKDSSRYIKTPKAKMSWTNIRVSHD